MQPNESLPTASNQEILLIDNYDSFTYNIVELLAKIGVQVHVRRNDDITIEEIQAIDPSYIIVSPGPGSPENPEDIGVSSDAISYAIAENKALLGVCLGHQALVHHFGGKIVRAKDIMHGKTSILHRTDENNEAFADLYEGMQQFPEVMRYHSLAADAETFPHNDLVITSRTEDGTIMSVAHRDKAIFGVQYHPESFRTPEGETILRNFLATRSEVFARLLDTGLTEDVHLYEPAAIPEPIHTQIESLDVQPFSIREFPCELDPETFFERIHALTEDNYCFESLSAPKGDEQRSLSYFGAQPVFSISARNEQLFLNDQPVDTINGASPYATFDSVVESLRKRSDAVRSDEKQLPGQRLTGGFVGAMSFEAMQYLEPTAIPQSAKTPEERKTFEYAYFDDGFVYDSVQQKYYYYTRGRDRFEHFNHIAQSDVTIEDPVITPLSAGTPQEEFTKNASSVKGSIIAGETFQTVISQKKTFTIEGSMHPVYCKFRETCPSGNMHYLSVGSMVSAGSFPELTLRIEDGISETFQVAGTRKRAGNEDIDAVTFAELLQDHKEIAEHTMLVDLARNDSARSSKLGTQTLSEDQLFQRLDAGPVMHIASRVRAELNGMTPASALLSVHPMGTVSGAPKERSTRILYEHEGGEARGLYAGSIGFLDMTGDLEAVVGLRSIIREGNIIKIQAGAGIVYDSDPTSEYLETEQKMGAPSRAIEPFIATQS